MDVRQGNAVSSDMAAKLKVGQSRLEVRQILGTPQLSDIFHANRWDYPYLFEHRGSLEQKTKFSVFFEDDKLARWEGDKLPDSPISIAKEVDQKAGNPMVVGVGASEPPASSEPGAASPTPPETAPK